MDDAVPLIWTVKAIIKIDEAMTCCSMSEILDGDSFKNSVVGESDGIKVVFLLMQALSFCETWFRVVNSL